MNKYHGGKIYALRSPSTDKIYIGSTIQPLYKRKASHNKKKSNDLSKLGDFYIELIENFKCENREELNKREGELIRLNNKCINKNIAGRTNKEYTEEHKERLDQWKKEWYEEHKKELSEKRKKEYVSKKKSNVII